MKGKLIKGKNMPKYLQALTTNILGCFAADQEYFLGFTPMGLMIFEVEK